MSEIPDERFKESASSSFESAVMKMLNQVNVEPYKDQLFTNDCGNTTWFRFENGCLKYCLTSVPENNAKDTIVFSLESKETSFYLTQTRVHSCEHTQYYLETLSSAFEVGTTKILDYTGLEKLQKVLDSIEGLIDGDIFDEELQRIVEFAHDNVEGDVPRRGKRIYRILKNAGFSALVSMGQINSNRYFVPTVSNRRFPD